MTYVPGYLHDVFISYAHIDNEPLTTDVGWVTTFAGHLKNVLDKGLGSRDTSIWMDHGLSGHESFPKQIEDALRSSATLLVIASPSYLKSEWCTRERNAFMNAVRERSAAGTRVFRVDLEKLDQKNVPSVFHDLLGYPFWITDKYGNSRMLGFPVVDPLREPEYFTTLTKLRNALVNELKRLDLRKPGRATPWSGPAIFLADVTDDLDERREELAAYASQAGLTVLPQSRYPLDDFGAYQKRMEADLGNSKLFVQLLSEIQGRKPPGWFSRLPVAQYAEAKGATIPILQWRSRELDVEKLKAGFTEHYNLLAGSEVRACGIEEFKRAVVEEATRTPKPTTKDPGPRQNTLVFVNSDPADRPLLQEVCKCLKACGVGYSIPLVEEGTKPSEVREDLELNLSTCDGLILVYGNTPVTWVRRQLAQGRKILSQREAPLEALGILVGPPPDKQDVGWELPNMKLLDWRAGFRCADVTAFASALRSRR